MEPKTDGIGGFFAEGWDRIANSVAGVAGDDAWTSEREVARSRRGVESAQAEVAEEQAEFEAALGRFRSRLEASGYTDFDGFDNRVANLREARASFRQANRDFDAAQERMEAALDAPRGLDRRAEQMFRSHVNLPESAFQEAIADFRAHDRGDLADALVSARSELREAAAAQRAADRAITQYQQAAQELRGLNVTDGRALSRLQGKVEDEHDDVVDAIDDLVEAQQEYRQDAAQYSADMARALGKAQEAYRDARRSASEARESVTDSNSRPEAPEVPVIDYRN